MILVDVFVPSIDMNYDFQLNDEVPVKQVIEEITQMIEQKEHTNVVGDTDQLILCDRSSGKTLDPSLPLRESGVQSGHSLILV